MTLTNDDAGSRFMGGLGALAHYQEQNRALALLFGEPLETFWGVIDGPWAGSAVGLPWMGSGTMPRTGQRAGDEEWS